MFIPKIDYILNGHGPLFDSLFQVKRRLENLDSVNVVTVVTNATSPYGSREWNVTFETEVGDLPMMEITTGRLTGIDKEMAIVFPWGEWFNAIHLLH